MNYFHPCPYHRYYTMLSSGIDHTHWPGHFLPPIPPAPQLPLTLVVPSHCGPPETTSQNEFHFFYGPIPVPLSVPPWYYNNLLWPQPSVKPSPSQRLGPVKPSPRANHSQALAAPWPEGFTLKGELRWGRLERVYGPRRELPNFVKEDLRRMYGTFPRTDVSISCQGGEFVVHGDPRVGEQEYRVEKKMVRQMESPEADNVSVIVKQRKKKRAKR
ncbi:uncharacterized protein LOC125311272 [Alosa alosa]|nr:uncharacterized protein LOC125311272 [Alosa alosa]